MAIKMPPKKADEKKAEAFIAKNEKPKQEEGGKSVVNLRMDNDLLARIDADAKRMGISRSAWLHVASSKMLDA
ncbi:ribbon-helix-helix protein, CopG family [Rhizobium sp. LjRoot30]|uniref:ribbon-helix-helix protein, CopG family n=1 Tax=Rhizobium sp. LjRoot30 TaxID=3342320 RepID=UPI003ECD31EF